MGIPASTVLVGLPLAEIHFGPLSITLLIGAAQGAILALLLWLAPSNRTANRFLSGLIAAVALMVTPYIIGFAGFYDAYPWLSFAPFNTGLAFGPLFFFYVLSLTGGPLPKQWVLHFAPYGVQFLAQALVFPLPLETKNWWDGVAYAPVIAPVLTIASLFSLAYYGRLSWHRYTGYLRFLEATRADGARFDPSWIRNALTALLAMGIVWGGFAVADQIDPTRNYFDRFWMYVGLSVLAIYLGIEGWRNSAVAYPVFGGEAPTVAPVAIELAAPVRKDWTEQALAWATEVDARQLWRDPEITLSSLARDLGTNTTYLSRALNEGLGVTFNAFINSKRVDEVKRVLADAGVEDDILTIAFDAGFNSKASFNRAFAEFANMAPSAFRKASRLKA